MTEPHTEVTVTFLPDCDIHRTHGKAYADALLPLHGSWGYVCKPCFDTLGCTLGLGRGQRLILDEPINTITTMISD